ESTSGDIRSGLVQAHPGAHGGAHEHPPDRAPRWSAAADEPVPDEGRAGLELGRRRERDLRAAAPPTQLGVDAAVRLAAAPGPRRDERVELLAELGEAAVVDGRIGGAAAPAAGDVVGLALTQEAADLVGVEQARQAEEVLLLLRAHLRSRAELTAV